MTINLISSRCSLCHRHSYLKILIALGLASLILTSQYIHAEVLEEKSAQLDSVRNKIEDVKISMEKSRLETRD